ncbi:MAG TPA: DUF2971 domain-containing protein [Terriglobia bacterium]|nr:DUF2971 domain-containing protein [Terriglobia bacterium]
MSNTTDWPPLPPTLARFRTYGNQYAEGKDKAAVYDALRGRLLFKPGSTFNDPFEGKPHRVPAFDEPAKQRAVLEEYLLMIARDSGMDSPNKWVETQFRGKTPAELTAAMIEAAGKADNDQIHLLCLMHPNAISTSLPWSHYADAHCGVCIEFDTSIPPVGFALPITYTTEYPTLKVPRIVEPTNAGMQKAFLTKAIDWHYEQEHRVLRLLIPDAGISAHLMVEWDGQVALARADIAKTLTLGVKMPQPLRKELVEWTRTHAPHVQVFQAALHPSRYEVTRTRIS